MISNCQIQCVFQILICYNVLKTIFSLLYPIPPLASGPSFTSASPTNSVPFSVFSSVSPSQTLNIGVSKGPDPSPFLLVTLWFPCVIIHLKRPSIYPLRILKSLVSMYTIPPSCWTTIPEYLTHFEWCEIHLLPLVPLQLSFHHLLCFSS